MKNEDQIFLNSGIIEDYYLGIASEAEIERLLDLCDRFLEAQQMLDKGNESMVAFLKLINKTPPPRLRDSILNNIASKSTLSKVNIVGEDLMLDQFVPISPYSDADHWNTLLASFEPPKEFDNIYTKPLYESNDHNLTLVWAKELVPDEVHTDETESFFILDGTVDCHIGDEVFHMEKGDYMLIPMHTHHKVVVTSQIPGKAIMSRVAV